VFSWQHVLTQGAQWLCGMLDLRAQGRGFEYELHATTLYKRQLGVPSLRCQLMSTCESCGVNGHTTRCTWSYSFGWYMAVG